MKLNKLITPIAAFFFLLTVLPVHAAKFTDVPENSTYALAIEYLSNVGVIQGYPDQTFRPDQNVNRVEFLKLVLESSEVEFDVSAPTPFPDIDEGAWYAKYVRKAKSEEWIEGYPDGTFRPEQSINKVEALKIIGEVQQWSVDDEIEEKPYNDTELDEWFTPYIVYAKEKNFLEERTSNYFPELILSRAKISELLFRSYITRKSGAEKYSQTLATKYPASTFAGVEPEEPVETASIDTPPKEFTPVSFNTYDADFFDGVTLTADFPNTYYQNEVYYFEGSVYTGSPSSVFIFLAPEGSNNNDDYFNYVSDVNTKKFTVPVIFRESGNYKMGLIRGNEGESKIVDISVLPSLPEMPLKSNSKTPSALNVEYKDGQTTFSWDNKGSEFIKLTISQENTSKTFYFRQEVESIDIDYTDFVEFEENLTEFTVEGAMLKSENPLEFESSWSDTFQESFNAVTHTYSEIFSIYVTVNDIPESLDKIEPIHFTGTAKTDLFVEAAVIKPDGFVDLFDLTSPDPFTEYFGSNIIPEGNDFVFNYSPTKAGTYIVEVNGIDGSAVINTPVYVASGIPLLPDFFDLNLYTTPEQNFNLLQSRNEMLTLINDERRLAGLPEVTLNSNLNTLAQAHSDDMAEREFFGHINPDGQTPNDRRLELGIEMPVGENLAISPTVLYTHKGLMQSGIHRSNVLDPSWTKVGIGIAVAYSGSLITTQEFSSESYSDSDLSDIENDLFEALNRERSAAGLAPFDHGNGVQTAADEWSKKMAEQNFFDFTSPNGDTLSGVVNQYVPGKPVQALILESVSSNKLQEEAVKSDDITKSEWQKVGIGVKNDSTGSLKTTILFTTY